MDERVEILARRARRLRHHGEFRKAANVYGELTSVEPTHACWWVLLGVMLAEARRIEPSLKALRQAAYLYRQQGELGRERAVRSLLAGMAEVHAAA